MTTGPSGGEHKEKEVTFRKSTIVETSEETNGTRLDQLHRIKPDRLEDCLSRGLELYRVKALSIYNYEGLRVGDYVFACFNGVNYVTERILDEGTINAIPPSKNSDKSQCSGYTNKYGGFEDKYRKVDMGILLSEIEN